MMEQRILHPFLRAAIRVQRAKGEAKLETELSALHAKIATGQASEEEQGNCCEMDQV